MRPFQLMHRVHWSNSSPPTGSKITSAPFPPVSSLILSLRRSLAVIHQDVGSVLLGDLQLLIGAGPRDHARPKRFADFDCRQSHAAAGSQDEQVLPRLQSRALRQRMKRGAIRDSQGRGGIEVHRVGDDLNRRRIDDGPFGHGAGSRQCHDPVARLDAADAHADLRDDPRELGSRREREGGLELVFSRNLQDVRKVESGRIDVDQHLSAHGRRVRDLFQGQVFRRTV